MACSNCGGRVSEVAGNTNVVTHAQSSLNPSTKLEIKVGEPLSTACERGHILGAIPEVIRHPGFTVSAGGIPDRKTSSGGIQNMASFFKARHGCYHDKNAQLPSTCA